MKNFNAHNFLNDIENIPINEINRFADPFAGFVTLFKSIMDRHATIKQNKIWGNQASFMNEELSRAIKNRSRITNKYNKYKSRENYLEYQNIKKKCKFLTKKAKHEYFEQILSKGIIILESTKTYILRKL